jgi:hypothetical protein
MYVYLLYMPTGYDGNFWWRKKGKNFTKYHTFIRSLIFAHTFNVPSTNWLSFFYGHSLLYVFYVCCYDNDNFIMPFSMNKYLIEKNTYNGMSWTLDSGTRCFYRDRTYKLGVILVFSTKFKQWIDWLLMQHLIEGTFGWESINLSTRQT